MLEIDLPSTEYYDEYKNEFVTMPGAKVTLEHSLLAISKWEAKWGKIFLKEEEKTHEQLLDYIRCMVVEGSIDPFNLPASVVQHIYNYVNSPQTATVIYEARDHHHKSETLSSELIYYSMVAAQVPFEAEKWHINRLLTLLRIYSIKSNPDKNKLSAKEAAIRRHQLNQARKAKRGSK